MELKRLLLLVSLLTALEVAWSVKVGGAKRCPGAPYNISKNDPDLNKAVLVATEAFNNQSNDAFLFRTSAVDRAQRQIIKGILYILEVRISRTVCLKREGRDLSDCDFQPEGPLRQTFQCRFKVVSRPWLHLMMTTSLACQS